jgi:hypothetical protein
VVSFSEKPKRQIENIRQIAGQVFLIRQVAGVDDGVSYEAGSWSGKSFRTSSKNKPHTAGQVYATV